ncbi:MAG: hypothetical protein ACK4ZU_16080 [Allorhizobium sp.]
MQPVDTVSWVIARLTPRFEVSGKTYVMATHRLAALPLAETVSPSPTFLPGLTRSRAPRISSSRAFEPFLPTCFSRASIRMQS